MVDSIHLNYISTLGFNKINPNYFLCPEHFLTFKLFKLSYIKGDNKMYNKKQFINNWDLTLVLGEDIAQELNTKNPTEILETVWKNYKPKDFAEHGFYRLRGIVYDLETEIDEFAKVASKTTFKKACEMAGYDHEKYENYL